jgi:NADH:ubiquinone oxidoreductase subunit D
MAELERLANHCGDIGAICNDAAFALMLAHCAVLREQVLRASADCFGHRLLMDCILPGGVGADLPTDGGKMLRTLVAEIRRQFPPLVDLYDNTASLQDRTVRHRLRQTVADQAVRLWRDHWPRRGPGLRRPPRSGLSALRSTGIRDAAARPRAMSMPGCGCGFGKWNRVWR